jgi:hypothetical protein
MNFKITPWNPSPDLPAEDAAFPHLPCAFGGTGYP